LKSFSTYHGVSKSAWLLPALGPFSYRGRELFLCWLYFGLVFAGLVLLIAGGRFICRIAKSALDWAAPVVASNDAGEDFAGLVPALAGKGRRFLGGRDEPSPSQHLH
jgi:hypothetical protein